MNKIVLNYLLKGFLMTFSIFILVFYSFGVILNLFEEIEFFKNINVNIFTPLILTIIYIPSMIINFLPFIIFLSSMWFLLKIKNNRNLLTLKIYGYSNLKIFFILAFTSFILGWLVLFIFNPITSTLSKYYEITKSEYSRDIDHLVTFNKNGLWIKENLKSKKRIISAERPDGLKLINLTIFHLNQESKLIEKIKSEEALIKENTWILKNVTIFKLKGNIYEKEKYETYKIDSIYNYEKINNLFKNFDTLSFLDLIFNNNELINNGYNQTFLNQSLHSMLSLPFFLFLMTALATSLTLNTMKKSNNFSFIVLGIFITILMFYFKDLSLALAKTDRIPMFLGIWAPTIALSLFTFIGVLQINEN